MTIINSKTIITIIIIIIWLSFQRYFNNNINKNKQTIKQTNEKKIKIKK